MREGYKYTVGSPTDLVLQSMVIHRMLPFGSQCHLSIRSLWSLSDTYHLSKVPILGSVGKPLLCDHLTAMRPSYSATPTLYEPRGASHRKKCLIEEVRGERQGNSHVGVRHLLIRELTWFRFRYLIGLTSRKEVCFTWRWLELTCMKDLKDPTDRV